MPTNTEAPMLSRKWQVNDVAGRNFGLAVTGTVFDADGNLYFSALDGIYFIDNAAVSAITATAVVKKVSENFGLMDLATNQFPIAWTPPFVGAVLPVKLLQFTGAVTNGNVQLNWRVASNEASRYFELEKSESGAAFKTQTLLFTTDRQGEES